MQDVELIIDKISNITSKLSTLKQEFDKLDIELEVFNNDQLFGAKNQIFNAIKRFEYVDNQAPRETFQLTGVLSANQQMIDIVKSINLDKSIIRQSYSENHINKNKLKRNYIANATNLPRLSIKQLTRKIPVIDYKPDFISFSLCNTKSIKKVNKEFLIDKLKDRYDSGAKEDLLCLELTNTKEFALISESYQHLRANIRKGVGSQCTRKQLKCSLPLFVYCEDGKLPVISKPFNKNYSPHYRDNSFLSDESFLKTIQVFEYLK